MARGDGLEEMLRKRLGTTLGLSETSMFGGRAWLLGIRKRIARARVEDISSFAQIRKSMMAFRSIGLPGAFWPALMRRRGPVFG